MDPRRERRLKLFGILEETVEKAGYECLDIELTHEAERPILRVFIDSPGGIGVEDCEKVSKALGAAQDAIDPFFRGRHYLEVSSPGLERPLKKLEDFRRFNDSTVRIQLRECLEGRKNFKGKIHSVERNRITLLTEDGDFLAFPFESIRKANLAFDGEI